MFENIFIPCGNSGQNDHAMRTSKAGGQKLNKRQADSSLASGVALSKKRKFNIATIVPTFFVPSGDEKSKRSANSASTLL